MPPETTLVARALRRLAKEILAAYPYAKFKEFIVGSYDMLREARRFAFGEIAKGGYALHHFGDTTHLISPDCDKETLKNYAAVLKGEVSNPKLKAVLEAEIAHLVVLPVWFHDYLHHNKIPDCRSRRAFYTMLTLVLETAESYEKIKALQFRGENLLEAIKSIKNLAAVIPDKANRELLKKLEIVYGDIKNGVIDGLQRWLQ